MKKRCRVGILRAEPKGAKNKKGGGAKKSTKKFCPNFHNGQILCCAISPDDKYLITGGSDSLIKFVFMNFNLIFNFKIIEFGPLILWNFCMTLMDIAVQSHPFDFGNNVKHWKCLHPAGIAQLWLVKI